MCLNDNGLKDPGKLNVLLKTTRLIKEITVKTTDPLSEYQASIKDIFEKIGQYVQLLELDITTADENTIWEILKLVPNLHSLDLTVLVIQGFSNERYVIKMPKLRSLKLALPDSIDGDQFKTNLIKSAESSLKSLECVGGVDQLSTVEHLRLSYFLAICLTDRNEAGMTKFLRNQSDMETLCVRIGNFPLSQTFFENVNRMRNLKLCAIYAESRCILKFAMDITHDQKFLCLDVDSNRIENDLIKGLSSFFQSCACLSLKTNSTELIDKVLNSCKNLIFLRIGEISQEDELDFSQLDDKIPSNLKHLDISLSTFGFHPDTASKLARKMPHLMCLAIKKCSRLTSVEFATLLDCLEELRMLRFEEVDSVPDQIFQTLKDHRKKLNNFYIGADFDEETVCRQFEELDMAEIRFSCNNFTI